MNKSDLRSKVSSLKRVAAKKELRRKLIEVNLIPQKMEKFNNKKKRNKFREYKEVIFIKVSRLGLLVWLRLSLHRKFYLIGYFVATGGGFS